ncbi:MAG TPA: glycosyltransferase [Streptosporangiaceae bacterium]|nr:glycosyltransferase [Streptosporangiaceae bacterium]
MTGTTGPIRAVGVVVPAHNEEDLLPACLSALRDAAETARAAGGGLPVRTVVVADGCTDRTALIASSHGAGVVRVSARAVGAARAAGVTELLRRSSGVKPRELWLATTDADTAVPPNWLARQLGYAEQGWDAVVGTVTVSDWAGRPARLPAAFAAHYASGDGTHPHVHGANLGIRASAYLGAGGFRELATAEDHAIVSALTRAGFSAARATDVTVRTSGRPVARAPYGFSCLLGKLAAARQSA